MTERERFEKMFPTMDLRKDGNGQYMDAETAKAEAIWDACAEEKDRRIEELENRLTMKEMSLDVSRRAFNNAHEVIRSYEKRIKELEYGLKRIKEWGHDDINKMTTILKLQEIASEALEE
jgi:hypothetical protein